MREKLNKAHQKTIEEKAESLLKQYEEIIQQEVSLPIPVELIAEDIYDLRIYRTIIKEGISGKLDLNQNFLILNSAHSLNRQRFTVAHELGHLQLHCTNGSSYFRKDKPHKEIESEANIFAASLLIPRKFLYEHIIKELIELVQKKKTHLEWLLIFVRNSKNFKSLNNLLCSYLFRHSKDHSEEIPGITLVTSLIPRLAKKFQVSNETMTRRFKGLGLLDKFIFSN